MTKTPLKINGVDFSADTQRLGYSIVYEDRAGNNGMMMQNGDQYLDVVTRRPVLTWRLDSLPGARLAALHAAINAAGYVEVEYLDSATNTVMAGTFHGTISTQSVGVIGPGGQYYRYTGPVLTMRSR